MLRDRKGHGSPFCVGSSIVTIIIGLFALRSLYGSRPSMGLLAAFAMFSILAQVIHLVEHGMTPIGGTASFINFVFAIFVIRYLIGNLSVMEDLLALLFPIALILELTKNFVP